MNVNFKRNRTRSNLKETGPSQIELVLDRALCDKKLKPWAARIRAKSGSCNRFILKIIIIVYSVYNKLMQAPEIVAVNEEYHSLNANYFLEFLTFV